MRPSHEIVNNRIFGALRMGLLKKVISCGRPGASRAAVWAARENGLLTGGHSSRSLVIEFDLNKEFGIVAVPITRETRTSNDNMLGIVQSNVDASNATIVVKIARNENLTRIIQYAREGLPNRSVSGHRPVLVISSLDDEAAVVQSIRLFLEENNVEVVHVCGHRAILFMKDYEERLKRIFLQAFPSTI